jgi:hypothetical protein
MRTREASSIVNGAKASRELQPELPPLHSVLFPVGEAHATLTRLPVLLPSTNHLANSNPTKNIQQEPL